jgi:hypothetical protein
VATLLACLAVPLLSFLAPLVLLLGLLGLAALRGRVVHTLALFLVEDGLHRLLAGGDVEQLIGVDRWAAPSRTRSRQVVPSRKACMISDWATLGSSVQRLEKNRMKSRSDSPGFWVHACRS